MLYDPLPVESHFDHYLHDNFNSEIVTMTLLPFLSLMALLLLPADALAVSGKVPSLKFYNNAQRS